MRGIDWDKVRRNRNVWKPDYREDFLLPDADCDPQSKSTATLNPTQTNKKIPYTQPLTARQIKEKLRSRGVTGSRLTEFVNAVLVGKMLLAWIEFDLDCEEMKVSGFVPSLPEEKGDLLLLRFRRPSPSGGGSEERVYAIKKTSG